MNCTHQDQIRDVPPRSSGCEKCLETGQRWVHLRVCLMCGHVGCCDASRGRHAAKHFDATGHAIMGPADPGESWRWCYIDESYVPR